jgi:hypothetical protein
VAPFLPNVLDLLAMREATRLPLTRDALCAHLRAVGPCTLVPPRACAYSRIQHPKLWAVVLTRYVGDWHAEVGGAAISGGIAAVAVALDTLADRLFDAAHADGDDTQQPDDQMWQLGLDYDDNGRPHPAKNMAALSPRTARVVALATGAAAAGCGSSSSSGGGNGGAFAGGTNASLADPLHGELPLCPLTRQVLIISDDDADDVWAYRRFAAVACLVDASEAAATTAVALRDGLTRRSQLPAPLWIGTLAGRYLALRAGLKAARLALRDDSVLCHAFMAAGCCGPQFTSTCSGTAADDDASALDYVVETMGEMQWLHSAGAQFRNLVRTYAVYADAYDSHAEYSAAVRAAKLVATRDYLAGRDASFGASVPPSLLRDLRRVQVEGDGCGDGPAKLTLKIRSGRRRGGGGRGRGGGACFTCGEYGHFARECPEGDDYYDDDDDDDNEWDWDYIRNRYRY